MLDAAIVVFSRGDYHTVSVEEIAAVAGTSKPTVYQYMGSKEGIFTACVSREADRLVATVRAAVHDPTAPPGEDPLNRGMRAFFTFVTTNRDSWTVLYRRAALQGEPFARETARTRDRVTAEVAALISECAHTDLPSQDVDLLARIAVSTADAFADWLLEHPEECPETMADQVTELTWSHLRNLCGPPAGV